MESTSDQQGSMLSIWDYVVFVVTLIFSALIGIYYYFSGNRQRSNQEYLLANKQMNVWVVSVSLMASFMSAITLLGVPAEIYSFGTIFFFINVSYAFGTPLSAHFFLPVFYRLNITSAYEYLELRFNRTVRILASAIFMLQMIFYMGIVLYAPAIALEAVTGLSKWAAIFSVGIICTIYCCVGGIKAVLWTDLFQSVLMFVSLIIVIVRGTIILGGFDNVMKAALDGGRINMNEFSFDPTIRHSFWTLTIGGIFIYTSIYGVNQTQVQRLLTTKSLRQAQISLYISWPVTSLLSVTCIISGLVMYAFFAQCDPIVSKKVTKPDQMLPYFMMKVCSSIPGLPGLFIAGIFSGALSSVSSFVNSLAAVTIEDLVKPTLRLWSVQLSEKKETLLTKLIALTFGILCLLFTVVAEQMKGILEASLTIFGVVGGPLLGLFTLGMISGKCSPKAAVVAFIFSLAFGIWIGFGSMSSGIKLVPLEKSIQGCSNDSSPMLLTESREPETSDVFYLYRVSYLYLAGMTTVVEIFIGLLLSCTCLPNRDKVDSSLISPLFGGSSRNEFGGKTGSDGNSLPSSYRGGDLNFPTSNHIHNGISVSQIDLNQLDNTSPIVYRHSASVNVVSSADNLTQVKNG